MQRNKRIRKEKDKDKGITLIALVVTIIILIILATISVNMVFSENGLIATAKEAREHQSNAIVSDQGELDKGAEEAANIIAGGNEKEQVAPMVTLANGTKITLMKENVYEYLGKKVTNYTGQSSVTIGGKSYTVSTEYRLYYVDFDNRYGDGEGTIYLKAECASSRYELPTTDASSDTEPNIKIRALNPALYAEGVTPPTATNINMKAVTWLTNTNNWLSLADTSKSSNINYIVGSPSLEMMIDSYNTHYRLTGYTPDTSTLNASSARVKLFYKYPPLNTNSYGYEVGPNSDSSATSGYDTYTSNYTVKTDTEIDTMYYPGNNNYYWLASPCNGYSYSNSVMSVRCSYWGCMSGDACNNYNTFCPLVSLKSNVQLQLQ